MKLNKITRDIHHWGAIIIAVPLLITIGAGLLLMVKKEFDWIQPPSTRGIGIEINADGEFDAQPLSQLFIIAGQTRPESFSDWDKLARVDIKPGRDIVKFVSDDNWEVQLDLVSGEVLQLSYRRSDLIESIHDGSFFAGWTQHFLFLPSGIGLFILWLTGIYMFFRPYYKKWQKRKAAK